jgi:UDP-N-acetyl-2-amino-2-deoxyglucuronate dehydrogenase
MTTATTDPVANPIGVAVIGCGGIGQTHARAFRELVGARLIGVSSRDADKARRVGEAEETAHTTDAAALIADPRVGLVSIATSSGSHAPLALAALQAGKHVVIEKPLAMNTDDGRRILAEGAQRGLTVSVIFQRRFEDTFAAVSRAVRSGALGRLLLVEASCPYFRPQSYYDAASWRGTVADDGGALMNQGIHLVDLLLWIGGPARRVTGQMATQRHQMEAEDLALAVINLQNGALATLLASTNLAPGFPHTLNVYGERGAIRTEGGAVTHWSVADAGPDGGINGPGAPPPAKTPANTAGAASPGGAFWSLAQHRAQLHDVLDAIRHRRPPAITGEDGLRAVALVEAVYRSAYSQTPVDVAF